MKILKTAVIGLGRIGWGTHIPKILAKPDRFALTAVVDLSQERLAEAKEKYGVNGYTDIPSMVEAEHPDLVVIASPTHLHQDTPAPPCAWAVMCSWISPWPRIMRLPARSPTVLRRPAES